MSECILMDAFNGDRHFKMAGERPGFTLELSNADVTRTRIASLSDLALDGLSSPSTKAEYMKTPLLTPTPTQFLFPRCVTAEQEDFSSGFSRALEELYRRQGRPELETSAVACDNVSNTSAGIVANALCMTSAQAVTNTARSGIMSEEVKLNNSPANIPPVATSVVDCVASQSRPSMKDILRSCTPVHFNTTSGYGMNTLQPSYFTMNNFSLPPHSVAACQQQTVSTCLPTAQLPYSSPPAYIPGNLFNTAAAATQQTFAYLSARPEMNSSSAVQPPSHSCLPSSSFVPADQTAPDVALPARVDMAEQEQWRLERKRAKNRVAAARCQTRKLERISQLQEKVANLQNNNSKLSETVVSLTKHVASLQQQILMHTERGCRLLLPAI